MFTRFSGVRTHQSSSQLPFLPVIPPSTVAPPTNISPSHSTPLAAPQFRRRLDSNVMPLPYKAHNHRKRNHTERSCTHGAHSHGATNAAARHAITAGYLAALPTGGVVGWRGVRRRATGRTHTPLRGDSVMPTAVCSGTCERASQLMHEWQVGRRARGQGRGVEDPSARGGGWRTHQPGAGGGGPIS